MMNVVSSFLCLIHMISDFFNATVQDLYKMLECRLPQFGGWIDAADVFSIIRWSIVSSKNTMNGR